MFNLKVSLTLVPPSWKMFTDCEVHGVAQLELIETTFQVLLKLQFLDFFHRPLSNFDSKTVDQIVNIPLIAF